MTKYSAAARVDAAESDRVERTAAGHHALRDRLGEGAENHVPHHVAGRTAIADGSGALRVEDRARGGHHLDRAEVAGIGRKIGIDQRLHGVIDAREHGVPHHVARARHLRIGAGEVEGEPIVLDRHLDPRAHRPRRDAVVIDDVFVLVGAVRQRADAGAHARLAVIEPRLDAGKRGRGAETLKDFLDPAGADNVGGDLRLEVAFPLERRARVEEDDFHNILAHLAVVDDAHRRQTDALLKDAGAVGAFAARHLAADVRVVGEVGDEGDDPPVAIDRAP